jgi:hypothetical protein
MPADYGFIKKTIGADGDEVDVFVGPHRQSEMVYVIDQCDSQGQFDEHKVMLGYTNYKKAIDAYRASYCNGWKVGKVTSMTIKQLKNWLAAGDQRSGIENQVSRYTGSINRYASFMQPGLFDSPEDKAEGIPQRQEKPPRPKPAPKPSVPSMNVPSAQTELKPKQANLFDPHGNDGCSAIALRPAKRNQSNQSQNNQSPSP